MRDFAFARELGVPISLHVGMAGYPGAVATLDTYGLLGPDINYVHGTSTTMGIPELAWAV
ncbi:MAG: 5-methylthioadenosine/S-adenosylhomocysteine deaminase, partial [Streptomyces sp.]|nr:5-methylthioadenosine/S-adenosylhomocysteine deaminase [Streptomyces sp.]